jgi:AcrR family transcriptional regulator
MAEDDTVSHVTSRERGRRKVPRIVRERQMLRVAERAFARRGFHAASVDAIAEGAGISKPMVYAYFGSKEGLYRACMDQARIRLYESLRAAADAGAAPDDQLWRGILAFFEFVQEQSDSWAILLGEATSGAGPFATEGAEVRRQIAEVVGDLLRRAAEEEGVDAAGLELTEPMARALIGAGESLAAWWREHPEQTREAVALLLMNFAWVGLGDLVRQRRWGPGPVPPGAPG